MTVPSRWIKYEEDREAGAERWGKAHISSLSFHALINLRLCLEKGEFELCSDELLAKMHLQNAISIGIFGELQVHYIMMSHVCPYY